MMSHEKFNLSSRRMPRGLKFKREKPLKFGEIFLLDSGGNLKNFCGGEKRKIQPGTKSETIAPPERDRRGARQKTNFTIEVQVM